MELIGIMQMITQGVWGTYSRVRNPTSLMQLPYITEDFCDKLVKKHKYKKLIYLQINRPQITSPLKFAELEVSKREALLKQEGLSDSAIATVEKVLKKLPIDVNMTHELTIQDDDITKGITERYIYTYRLRQKVPL
jgi:hypothetical protein